MAKTLVCTQCNFVGKPKKRMRGSFIMEIFLWLWFIFPGLFYSLWRLTTKEKVCPLCGSPNMIPEDSPKAKAMLAA